MDPQEPWPTAMDGVQNFACFIHSGCRGGGEIVHCHGEYGHDYAFGPDRWLQGLKQQFLSHFPCSALTDHQVHRGTEDHVGVHEVPPQAGEIGHPVICKVQEIPLDFKTVATC